MKLHEILTAFYPLSDTSFQKILAVSTEIKLKKGDIILHADKVENTLYFIKKGVVRAYSTLESGEITFWFGEEGDPIFSLNSYVNNERSYENIELLTDCELYKISYAELDALYQTAIDIANLGRKLAERELIKAEVRMITRNTSAAKERYEALLSSQPTLIQRVPLKYIASYLGITQVSLSRIRGGKTK